MKNFIPGIIAALLLLVSAVSAASPDYDIDKVSLNGMLITTEKVALELGTRTQIDVWLKGTGDKKDVKAKAWIGGYEYNDVQAQTEAFEVNNGISYRKELFLDIPRDLKLNSNDYKLHIEVFDKNNYEEKTYTVFIEERRHDIAILDAIIRPGTMIEAGRALAIQARLENFGQKRESNIKIEASIPELSTTSSTWMDFLDRYDTDDSSASTSFMPLQIPVDAKTGDYQLVLKVIYNNLHTEVISKRLVYVNGIEEAKATAAQKESIVSMAISGEAMVTEAADTQIQVANIGSAKKSYSIAVEGTENWANIAVSPDKFELAPGTGIPSVVRIIPTKPGEYQFTIAVLDGENTVKEQQVSFKAFEKGGKKTTIGSVGDFLNKDAWGDRRNVVLLVMIVVLLFALVIMLAHGMRQHEHHRFERP